MRYMHSISRKNIVGEAENARRSPERDSSSDPREMLSALYKHYLSATSPEELQKIRKNIADICQSIFASAPDALSASQTLAGIVDEISEIALRDPEKILASFNEKAPDPLETILATAKNLAIAKRTAERLSPHADAIVLSGANAWGPFFAVKGKHFEKTRGEKASDIDLFGIFEDAEAVVEAMSHLDATYGNPQVQQRALYFSEIFREGLADVFSVRMMIDGVEVSFHAYPRKTLEMIVKGLEPTNEKQIGFVRDFRETLPGNVRIFGGYPTLDILSGKTELFLPAIQALPKQKSYICDAPTGRVQPSSVSIGLTLFFLLIAPRPLKTSPYFEQQQTQLLERVHKCIGRQDILHIFREERMTKEVLNEIKHSLSFYE